MREACSLQLAVSDSRPKCGCRFAIVTTEVIYQTVNVCCDRVQHFQQPGPSNYPGYVQQILIEFLGRWPICLGTGVGRLDWYCTS
jgi:hypothetical protein